MLVDNCSARSNILQAMGQLQPLQHCTMAMTMSAELPPHSRGVPAVGRAKTLPACQPRMLHYDSSLLQCSQRLSYWVVFVFVWEEVHWMLGNI